jgi:hypothetical protein
MGQIALTNTVSPVTSIVFPRAKNQLNCPGADKVRHGDQFKDRQGVGPRKSTDTPRPRRRGDRVRRREFLAWLGGTAAWRKPLTAEPD